MTGLMNDWMEEWKNKKIDWWKEEGTIEAWMYWCTIEGCMNGYRQWNHERIDGGQTNECIERWYMDGSWIDWWRMDERKRKTMDRMEE